MKKSAMQVTRMLAVYHKIHDHLIREYEIDFISLDTLKTIVEPYQDDPLMYFVYTLNEEQILKFNEFVPALAEIDFEKEEVCLECFQVK